MSIGIEDDGRGPMLTARRVSRTADGRFAVAEEQSVPLAALWTGPMTVTDLADWFNVSRPGMRTLLKFLPCEKVGAFVRVRLDRMPAEFVAAMLRVAEGAATNGNARQPAIGGTGEQAGESKHDGDAIAVVAPRGDGPVGDYPFSPAGPEPSRP